MWRMVRVAVAMTVALSATTVFAATLNGTAADDSLRGTGKAGVLYGKGGGAVRKGSDQNLNRFVGCEKFVR